jgi:hypothetical protein
MTELRATGVQPVIESADVATDDLASRLSAFRCPLPHPVPLKMASAAALETVTEVATTLEAVMEAAVKPESISKEDERRETKTGSVGIVTLALEVSGVIAVPGRETKTVGGGEEIARRASRVDLSRYRRRGETNATYEQERRERNFSAIH